MILEEFCENKYKNNIDLWLVVGVRRLFGTCGVCEDRVTILRIQKCLDFLYSLYETNTSYTLS